MEKPTRAQILNATPHGLLATDAAGMITSANKKAAKMLGLSKTRLAGAALSEMLPEAAPHLEACLRTGTAQTGKIFTHGGVELIGSFTRVQRGKKVSGAVCTLLDARELKSWAQGLSFFKREHLKLETIFRFSSFGIWILDGEGKVLSVNPAAEKLIGIRSREVVGKDIRTLEERGVIDRVLTPDILAEKRPMSRSQHVLKSNKYILSAGTPVFDEHGNILFVVVLEHDMTTLKGLEKQLERHRSVAEKYKDALSDLNLQELRRQEIVAESEEMRHVLRVALKLARLDVSNILILGESGTGKGLLAKFIHKNSRRAAKPFIQVNCAALPETLLEAELFGYEKGAFTGAQEQGKIGLFELAQGGTLFLDEIGDLPLSVQAKLLKCLDDHEVMHLGGLKPIKINCIIIAATNRDLEGLVQEQKFRKDLFFRLNSFNIRIPPLRERPEDIFELAHTFLNKINEKYQFKKRLSASALRALQAYPFPGNVRELKNILKNAAILSDENILDNVLPSWPHHAEEEVPGAWLERRRMPASNLTQKLVEEEKELLERAMAQCRSTREMARFLGISQSSVVRKLRKHGL